MKKRIITIIIILIIIAIAAYLLINSKNTKQVAVQETTIQETKASETAKNVEKPAPLTAEDLNIDTKGNEKDVIKEVSKAITAYGPDSNAETNRGIKIGDNSEKVWAKYGKIEVSPMTRADGELWDYLKAHSDTDQRIKDALDAGDVYAKYTYHNPNDNKNYAVGFWFDPENNVKWIFHYTEGLSTEKELEEAAKKAN